MARRAAARIVARQARIPKKPLTQPDLQRIQRGGRGNRRDRLFERDAVGLDGLFGRLRKRRRLLQANERQQASPTQRRSRNSGDFGFVKDQVGAVLGRAVISKFFSKGRTLFPGRNAAFGNDLAMMNELFITKPRRGRSRIRETTDRAWSQRPILFGRWLRTRSNAGTSIIPGECWSADARWTIRS